MCACALSFYFSLGLQPKPNLAFASRRLGILEEGAASEIKKKKEETKHHPNKKLSSRKIYLVPFCFSLSTANHTRSRGPVSKKIRCLSPYPSFSFSQTVSERKGDMHSFGLFSLPGQISICPSCFLPVVDPILSSPPNTYTQAGSAASSRFPYVATLPPRWRTVCRCRCMRVRGNAAQISVHRTNMIPRFPHIPCRFHADAMPTHLPTYLWRRRASH